MYRVLYHENLPHLIIKLLSRITLWSDGCDVYWSLVNKVKMRVLFILRIIRNLILDVKVESSSLEVLEDIPGAFKWTLKEPVYIDNVLCVEVKGMSDAWDCVLKETTGTTSSTRVNSWGTVCDFGTGDLRVESWVLAREGYHWCRGKMQNYLTECSMELFDENTCQTNGREKHPNEEIELKHRSVG